MIEDNKNRIILVFTVITLLLSVLIISIVLAWQNQKKSKNSLNVTFKQIYLTDYEVDFLDDDYFYTFLNNKLMTFINKNGKEVYSSNEGIYFDGIYKLNNESYLIYANVDNNLYTYIFNGKDFSSYFTKIDVGTVKPLIMKKDNDSYIIGFVSNKDDGIYIYSTNKEELFIESSKFIGNNEDDKAYYVNNNYFVIENKDNLRGVIDSNGSVVIPCDYMDIINSIDDNFIVLNKSNKYGVLDKSNKVIVDFIYKVIYEEKDNYLMVNQKNKMALFDRDFKQLLDFKMNYNTNIDFNLRKDNNSLKIECVEGYIYVVNNYLEDFNDVDYKYHNMYKIKDKKIVDNIKQVGFGFDGILYTYDEEHLIKFYGIDEIVSELNLKDVSKIKNVEKINENIIEINYFNNEGNLISKYYDLNMKEITFDGSLVIKADNYYGFIREGDLKVLVIVDKDNNEVRSIKGNGFKIKGNYIIVDKGIYEIVQR